MSDDFDRLRLGDDALFSYLTDAAGKNNMRVVIEQRSSEWFDTQRGTVAGWLLSVVRHRASRSWILSARDRPPSLSSAVTKRCHPADRTAVTVVSGHTVVSSHRV